MSRTPPDPHAPVEHYAEFRCYEELNDFLPEPRRKRDFSRCQGCGRVYWPGSHRARLDAVIDRARVAAQH